MIILIKRKLAEPTTCALLLTRSTLYAISLIRGRLTGSYVMAKPVKHPSMEFVLIFNWVLSVCVGDGKSTYDLWFVAK